MFKEFKMSFPPVIKFIEKLGDETVYTFDTKGASFLLWTQIRLKSIFWYLDFGQNSEGGFNKLVHQAISCSEIILLLFGFPRYS